MMRLLSVSFVTFLLGAGDARAQDGPAVRRLVLRVVSAPARGVAVVDRGSSDHVAIGDRVELTPRDGSLVRGAVIRVEERTSVVELVDRDYNALPGTRGEVLVPSSRFAPKPPPELPPHVRPPQPPAPQPPQPQQPESQPQAPEHPPWRERDEGFTPDKPLLSQMRAIKPEERAVRFAGRVYGAGDLTLHPENDYDESFLRVGTDLRLENPVSDGGLLRFNGEYNARAELDDDHDSNVRVRDLSYTWGGTRFREMRFQVGRFLQHGMPELGVLDGGEWNWRMQDGHRVGASLGFLPVPDHNFDGLIDFQVAAHWLWAVDPAEALTFGAAFQKTFHDNSGDRDLFVLKSRYVPEDAWQFDAATWIDWYHGNDAVRGSGVEISQVVANATRAWGEGNRVQFSYRRLLFPDIDRREFLPLQPNLLVDDRADRLAVDLDLRLSATRELRTYHAGFDDEDYTGGAVELGVDSRDMFGDRTQTYVAVFGNTNQFSSLFGARVDWTRQLPAGRWNAFYEIFRNHEYGIDNSYNDLLHHRLRVLRDVYWSPTLDVMLYAEARLWGEDVSWSIGFQFQKTF
jgi:hypothetical protein